MFLFIIEEWESVSPDSAVGNTPLSKALTDCFRDAYDDLQDESVYTATSRKNQARTIVGRM